MYSNHDFKAWKWIPICDSASMRSIWFNIKNDWLTHDKQASKMKHFDQTSNHSASNISQQQKQKSYQCALWCLYPWTKFMACHGPNNQPKINRLGSTKKQGHVHQSEGKMQKNDQLYSRTGSWVRNGFGRNWVQKHYKCCATLTALSWGKFGRPVNLALNAAYMECVCWH